jgi:hypothetical protein
MSLGRRNWLHRAATYRSGVMLLCCLSSPLPASVDVPAHMLVTGTISASETISPSQNDQVHIVLASTGQSQAVGAVLDDSGSFAVELSESSGFNGTVMSARIKHGGTLYHLLDGSEPVEFRYSGGLFPNRISLGLTIGEPIGGAAVSADLGDDTDDTSLASSIANVTWGGVKTTAR